jgi:uncharacterized repeat protein (TIGR02543 family)
VAGILGGAGTLVDKPDDPTRSGYTFVGWYDSIYIGGNVYAWPYILTGDVTMHAHWIENAQPQGVLVSLSVSALPDKLVYEQGESADWTGLEVTGTYSDGSAKVETDYGYINLDSWSLGAKAITVTKNGISAPPFTVIVRTLTALSISSEPVKQQYEVGEDFDRMGLVVEGIYSDGSSAFTEIIDYPNYDISGFDSASPGVQTITVRKTSTTGNYYNYSDSFIVTVEGLTSLTISSEPVKQVYDIGETPDWTGLTVTGHYVIAGDKTETIDYANEISGFDSSSPGVKTITVTKNGVSAPSFTVEVLPRGSGSITIVPPSQAGDIALTWTGTTSITVTAPGGYAGYQWFVDDMARPADSGSDGTAITLDTTAYSTGKHRVRVTAYKQGFPYSGETAITLP